MKTKESKAVAVVTIHGPGRMHLKGRKAIAKWLAHVAEDLVKLGDQYSDGRFTARYHAFVEPKP